jgi:lysophospholipase L1-like esterase
MGQWTKKSTSVSTPSKWTGKIWNAMGDSITEVNFRANTRYHDYIKSKIGCTVNNYGISGTGYFCGSSPFAGRVNSMAANADLITVFGGTNDWDNVTRTLVLGAYGDTSATGSFYGAVDSTLTQLIAKYPTKTIAVFTPLPRANGYGDSTKTGTGYTMKQIADAIIQVCNKYSIPVLDLYRNSSLFPWDTTANATYFKDPGADPADGLHPNDAGHAVLADKILSFLNTL